MELNKTDTKNINFSLLFYEFLNKKNIKSLNHYLNYNFYNTYNPYQFKNMKQVIKKIIDAIQKKQEIIIYNDLSIDNIIATKILFDFISPINQNTKIINYFEEIDNSTQKLIIGFGNIVKCDNNLQTNIIYINHSFLPNIQNNTLVPIIPCPYGETYPTKEICNSIISFKIVQGLSQIIYKNNYINIIAKYTTLVGISIIYHDLSLELENHILLKSGLSLLNKQLNKQSNIIPDISIYYLFLNIFNNNIIDELIIKEKIIPLLQNCKKQQKLELLQQYLFTKKESEVINLYQKIKQLNESNTQTSLTIIESNNFDLETTLDQIDYQFIQEICLLKPFGKNNDTPKIKIKNFSFKNISFYGTNNENYKGYIYDNYGKLKFNCYIQKQPTTFLEYDGVIEIDTNHFINHKEIIINLLNYYESDNKMYHKLCNQYTIYANRLIDYDLNLLGINDKKIKQFNKENIYTINQLLSFYPKKYLDYRKCKNCSNIINKENCSIIGTVKKIGIKKITYAICVDENNQTFMVCWFNQSYVAKQLKINQKYIFCGDINIAENGMVQIYPSHFSDNISKLKTLIPIYKKIKGMSNEFLTETIEKALDITTNVDFLEKEIVDKFNLMSMYDVLYSLHKPKNDNEIKNAQNRLIFNQIFKFCINYLTQNEKNKNNQFPIINKEISWNKLKEKLPFSLTDDQNNAINEMKNYLFQGKYMHSLVQGDVGAGKTIVAFFMTLLMKDNNYQSCIIAPTEVLAKQHYNDIVELFQTFNIHIGFLVGSLKAKEKKEMLQNIQNGKIDIVVGTHAIIQENVIFKSLGLIIVDEQHKFGVKQREFLTNNQKTTPHLLTMSATPIPRTLAMSFLGDYIQVYTIKQKPKGRKENITQICNSDKQSYDFMFNEIKKGHQCYVVCPFVDKSQSSKLSHIKSANEEFDNICNYFQNENIKIALVTGKMKQFEIDNTINQFKNKEYDILISTTIIEVGVNVPNATVILIKNAERFGLAQIHQLRGRVGRGNYQSYCLLQTTKENNERCIALCSSNDGFEISKKDLLLRGAGDFIGNKQSGFEDTMQVVFDNEELYTKINKEVKEILSIQQRTIIYEHLLIKNK